ncbi:MAG: adenosine kinase [Planctomycetes bacterium]|nr:adenosine kinase [Planctomycetota bacterium]MCW8134478.1 adenosine kinase [Planctomycetota bacterium]
MSELDVIAIGNALVDVLAHSDDSFLASRGIPKGSMQLIDATAAERLYAEMGAAVEVSGGSAANTVAGIASLGGRAGFIGKVHADQLGDIFAHDIRALGVEFTTAPARNGRPTGRCLILVTPDAQRTMQTFLGVAGEVSPDDVDPSQIKRAQVTYFEGYLFDAAPAKAAYIKAAQVAHEAGRKVSLSLSDKFCVDRHRAEFLDLVHGHIDVLFANELEIMALYEAPDFGAAVSAVRGKCDIAVLTRSEKGAVIITPHDTLEIPAHPVARVVDTTGAGDLFAAGFLYGYTRGKPLAECGRVAAICASEIISHFGARPEAKLAELVR